MKTLIQEKNHLLDNQLNSFKDDVLRGLGSKPKFLQPKYFYDANGDRIFQEIMRTPEYYLTDAELEIIRTRCTDIVAWLTKKTTAINVIELGAGDALKSAELLKCLLKESVTFTYVPIDISENVITLLEKELPQKLPGLQLKGFIGDYFEALSEAAEVSGGQKLVLLLGANIGNMFPYEAELFLKKLRSFLSAGDLVLVGFDLKKNPWTVFRAYNDWKGITKDFNLNLLRRINHELDGDFNIELFDHYESYDPETGACKSYLISLADQIVTVAGEEFRFEENECIFMEISQKYSLEEINQLAKVAGFLPLAELQDSKKQFVDVIWQVQ
ncbi:L-histidine N(alpha)-methyltransferase [Pedobacter sp. SYSU D00535]|uniref:L-histidine N(alpha)-methyltransferase n=1 Tax=Pedobacter sp. SYSU D00535 TaxID=2810308 RepID=UPI001A957085|nr:L-histidine N(alpha)-methyltransferase [Pedobacter sp. SYSU D00535]